MRTNFNQSVRRISSRSPLLNELQSLDKKLHVTSYSLGPLNCQLHVVFDTRSI
jgi:hypothetical protein